jgi:hypothetical protein
VKLANDRLDECRRSVQDETFGHPGPALSLSHPVGRVQARRSFTWIHQGRSLQNERLSKGACSGVLVFLGWRTSLRPGEVPASFAP